MASVRNCDDTKWLISHVGFFYDFLYSTSKKMFARHLCLRLCFRSFVLKHYKNFFVVQNLKRYEIVQFSFSSAKVNFSKFLLIRTPHLRDLFWVKSDYFVILYHSKFLKKYKFSASASTLLAPVYEALAGQIISQVWECFHFQAL